MLIMSINEEVVRISKSKAKKCLLIYDKKQLKWLMNGRKRQRPLEEMKASKRGVMFLEISEIRTFEVLKEV